MPTEFAFIDALKARVRGGEGVRQGIGDDGAVLAPPAGEELVVSTDTLVAGVHFPQDAHPADVGYKAAAVNLSDLAAMGATPRWCTLALTVPSLDPGYVEPLVAGLLALLDAHATALVGGDTTRGPLALTLTAIGSVPAGQALRRNGARPGDAVYVSGTLGDAAAALALRGTRLDPQDGEAKLARTRLAQRLARPTPRVALGQALRGLAHACIDVSDGLAADLGHICRQSGVAAVIEADALPVSRALAPLEIDPARRLRLQLGGDDYELCFALAPEDEAQLAEIAHACHVPLTRIGSLGPGEGVHVLDHAGRVIAPPVAGYEHFG
ncbi:MAG: thiamine-monophosphate kinase [Lysobacterales bacterium]|nr:Thiamine-monophosphate kinase [Xanthomonadales bacterium]